MSSGDSSETKPVVQFKRIPIAHGPLDTFDQKRSGILHDVVERTFQEFSGQNLENLLSEGLYAERLRLKRFGTNVFTKKRKKADLVLWSQIQSGLLKNPAEVDRKVLLRNVLDHYSSEIGGHFNPGVYSFSTRAVPFFFNWMLNALSVRHFLPWKMTASLADRIQILGEVPQLQRLSKKGTILLVPTHQSNIDSVLLGYLIYLMGLPPFSYGAGLNLFSNPLLSFFMSRLGAYTVDRSKRNQIYVSTLKNYSSRILQEGVHSIFFPGGGRSRSGGIEKKIKLGLLGTALEAQVENYRANRPNPRVYIVPMVTSYHFVLEASSLIEDYLAEAGKARFILMDDESWQVNKVIHFFTKFLGSQTGLKVRLGRAMDVFGNPVDDEGESQGPNGVTIDPKCWLTTRGELKVEPQRDHEYTRRLGNSIVNSFHKENTVLTSQLVAFAFFESLRVRYPDYELFRFLRLAPAQRGLPFKEFLGAADRYREKLLKLESQGQLFVSDEIKTTDTEAWVRDGVRQLGLLHEHATLKIEGDAIHTEDMNLLYYYRNRLTGYGLSLLASSMDTSSSRGATDEKGFLA